ncbi:MAG: TadE/TadG family type IV pilus assembly protein [Chloroflexota bacterium]
MVTPPVARKEMRGQSFIELAIALPILLLLLAGMLEVGFLFFAYMTAVDQTREAARFASTRDYEQLNPATIDPAHPEAACHDAFLHYFYDTACFFTDRDINPTLPISATRFEDVTISVFTIAGAAPGSGPRQVLHRYPEDGDGVWSLYNNNWTRDCEGNTVLSEPFFTNDEILGMLQPDPTPDPGGGTYSRFDRGLVLVEVFFCYEQKMGLLDFRSMDRLIPNPMRLHAYTIMPAPEALPQP